MAGEAGKTGVFLRQAWQRRWWLLGVQVLVAVAALATFHLLPPKYQSSTWIRFEPDSVINPLTQGLAVSSSMENVTGTMRHQLSGRKHIEDVIEYLGLESSGTNPSEHYNLVTSMAMNIDVELVSPRRRTSGASYFHITYIGGDPNSTQDVTKALASLFIEKTQAVKRSESDAAYDFINQQLGVYLAKLEESESALRNFVEQHMDELPESRNSNLNRLESLRATLRDVRHRIDQARIQKDLLIKRISGDEGGVAGNSAVVPNPLQEVLREKEVELQTMRRRYSESYPDIVSLRAEVESLKAEIGRNPTVLATEARRIAPTHIQETILTQLEQVNVELETLTARIPQLETQIRAYEKKVQSIPRQEQELVRLQRDYDVDSSIYEMFLRRLEEARVSRELEQAKKGDILKVVEAANFPLSPYSPDRKIFFFVGIAAGLILNGGLLYWLFSRDTSFRTARDAEAYLGLTVVARIPRVSPEGQRKTNWINALSFFGALGVYGALYFGAFFWEKILKLLKAGG